MTRLHEATCQAHLILLADDDPDGREALRQLLEYQGYRVEQAADGPAAIALSRSLAPNLIMLDLGLPGIDGWEVARRLKSDARTQAIPIVALTGHVFEADRARAAAAGCDEFLPKPSEADAILSCVRRMIVRSASGGGAAS